MIASLNSRIPALAAIALWMCSQLCAQDFDERSFDSPELTIEWQFGLGGKIFGSGNSDISPNFSNQASFKITNHSNALINGYLAINLIPQGQDKQLEPNHRALSQTPVDIGPGTTKRFSFYLNQDRESAWNASWFYIRDIPGVEATFTDAATDTLLWRRADEYVVEEMSNTNLLRCLMIGSTKQAPTVNIAPGNTEILAPRQRPLDYTAIDPWQAADSFPIYAPMDAIVLSPEIDQQSLTLSQKRALAEYVVNHGILAIPSETADAWIEQLFANQQQPPFTLKQTADADLFLYGHGKVIILKMPQPGTSDTSSAWKLYDLIDQRLAAPLPWNADEAYWSNDLGANSTESAIYAAGFLSFYTLFGLVSLYLFRKSGRRKLIRCMLALVAVFSAGSVSLGVYLKSLPGDVEWGSHTEVCASGGAVQYGQFHLISAGGNNQNLQVTPPSTLLQPVVDQQYHYGDYYMPRERLRLDGDEHYGKAEVPILPWGHARWSGRAYVEAIQPLNVSLSLPTKDTREAHVTVTNPNSFPIFHSYILIQRQPLPRQRTKGAQRPISHFRVSLGSIPPMQTIVVQQDIRANRSYYSGGYRPLKGHLFVYLNGTMTESPSIQITPGKGFDLGQIPSHDRDPRSQHSFFQILDPADFPTDKELVDTITAAEALLEQQKLKQTQSRKQNRNSQP